MGPKMRELLDRVAVTALELHRANERRNPAHDWATENERQALSNLRAALGDLDREAEKGKRAA